MNSHAGAWPCAEREIGIAGSRPLAVQPSLREKSVGVRPKGWVSVQIMCADQDERTGRQWQAADCDVGRCLALYGWCRRIQSERFIKYGPRIREVLKIVGVWRSSPQHSVDFFVKPCLRLWVSCEKIPGPGERVRGRLVSSCKDRQGLVAQLLIAQSYPGFLIVNLEQEIEEIPMLRSALTPLGKQSIYESVHELHDRTKLTIAWSRDPAWEAQRVVKRVERIFQAHAQRMTDLTDVLRHAGGEHGLRDHFEGQLHHFRGDIDRLPFVVYPTGNPLFAHLGHPIGHRGYPRSVKNRLDNPPMPLPDLA